MGTDHRGFQIHILKSVDSFAGMEYQGDICHQLELPSIPQYKGLQIPTFKCFTSRLAIAFAQSIESRC